MAVYACTAFWGAAIASLSSEIPFGGLYRTWWISNSLGSLVTTPLLVAWLVPTAQPGLSWRRGLELAAVAAGTAAMAWIYFGQAVAEYVLPPHSYLLVLPLVWAALRLGQMGVSVSLGVLAIVVVGATLSGAESFPLGGRNLDERILSAQLFVGVKAVVSLLLGASIAELRGTFESLRESEARLRVLGDNLPDSMVFQFIGMEGHLPRFLYLSAGIKALHGLDANAVIREPALLFSQFPAEDFRKLTEAVALSMSSRKAIGVVLCAVLGDGRARWMHFCSQPRWLSDGRTVWDGIEMDITPRKDAEEAKARLEAQLQQIQKMECIGQLAGGVAHDFNNLLTSMLGFSELASESLPQESPAKRLMAQVIEGAKRGGALTQRLLAFARKNMVSPEIADLNRVVTGLRPMLLRLLGENLEFVFVPGPDLGWVNVDVGSIEQVIVNLVLNARDAMAEGGRLTVATSNLILGEDCKLRHPELVPGSYVLLSVTDNGIGMPAEVRSRLFEPFFTTKPVGRGTGMGLAMCHGMIKQSGGQIAVHSEPGEGSRFEVYLPRAAGLGSPRVKEPAPSEGKGHGETILFVEDDDQIRQLATQVLSKAGTGC